MDQVNLRSEFSEENCLLARSIAPTYYADRDIPIERAVASSARMQTVPTMMTFSMEPLRSIKVRGYKLKVICWTSQLRVRVIARSQGRKRAILHVPALTSNFQLRLRPPTYILEP